MFPLKSRAFSLVEVMIVVAIIALLAGVAIPGMLRGRRRAREAAAQATLKSLATACQTYAASVGDGLYPETAAILIASGEFALDLNTLVKGGYTYAVTHGTGGYTATADAPDSGNAADWDYQVTTGAILARRDNDSAGAFTTF